MTTQAGTIQQAALTAPANGDDLDADVVRTQLNALRATHNTHDAEGGVHFQSGPSATRLALPIAGTAGWHWRDTDTNRVMSSDGSAWKEVGYVPSAIGGVTIATTSAAGFAPGTDGAYDLGTSSLRWRDAHISRNCISYGDVLTKNAMNGGAYRALAPTGASIAAAGSLVIFSGQQTSGVLILSDNGGGCALFLIDNRSGANLCVKIASLGATTYSAASGTASSVNVFAGGGNTITVQNNTAGTLVFSSSMLSGL